MVFMKLNWLNRKFKRLKKTYKTVGFKKFLKNLFYKKHEEILIGVDLNKRPEFSSKKDLKIQRIGIKDQNVLLDFYRTSNSSELYPISRIENCFASGGKCFIAMRKNKIIGHFWWGNNKMNFKYLDPASRNVGDTFGLKDDDALAIDFFIIPEERGQGTVLEFFPKVLIELNKLGYQRCFGLVLPDNRGARWTYKLLGHIDFKRIVLHRILNYIVLIDKKIYFSPPFLSW